jgi:hypothetical protein
VKKIGKKLGNSRVENNASRPQLLAKADFILERVLMGCSYMLLSGVKQHR